MNNSKERDRMDSVYFERSGWWRRGFAKFMAAMTDEPIVAEYKRRWLGTLSGRVLEIGPGAGPNLAYYPAHIQWVGIEPNIHMHPFLREAAEKRGFTVDLRTGIAERLDADDSSMDAVVSTLVLCSVDDQAETLAEIRRVLKPGGRFIFVEHVAAPQGTWLRRFQNLTHPAFAAIGDGCHPNRETWKSIQAAGFNEVHIEHFRISDGIAGPHIAGYAVK